MSIEQFLVKLFTYSCVSKVEFISTYCGFVYVESASGDVTKIEFVLTKNEDIFAKIKLWC